jgi:hypothetical protein
VISAQVICWALGCLSANPYDAAHARQLAAEGALYQCWKQPAAVCQAEKHAFNEASNLVQIAIDLELRANEAKLARAAAAIAEVNAEIEGYIRQRQTRRWWQVWKRLGRRR